MVRDIFGKKKNEVLHLSIALVSVFTLIFISFVADFWNNIYRSVDVLVNLPFTKFLVNFSLLPFLYILLLLYRRWRIAEQKKMELEDVILSINPYALLVVDDRMRVTMCNRTIKNLLGYEEHEIVNEDINKLLCFAGADQDLNGQEQIDRADFSIREVAGRTKSGDALSLEMITANLKNHEGAVILLHDITDHKIRKEKLLVMQKAVENMQIGVTITNERGIILYSNHAEAEMHGYSVDELIGKDVRIFGLPESHNPMSEQMMKHLKRFRRESVNIRMDGSTFPVQLMSDVVTSVDGKVIALITTCEDITDRKRNDEYIRQIAYYDTLTGLPNRSLFNDILKQELARSARHKKSFAIMFIDLDRFKVINDTLGHSVGDQLLMTAAHRLKNIVRESDTVCRLGGDEFIILLPELDEIQSAAVVASKITEKLSESFILNGREIYITASIGISVFPLNGYDIESLTKNADSAMYQAKEQGRNNYQFYNPNENADSLKKFSLQSSLRKSLKQRELSLHYQPQFSLSDGKLIGAEALLRSNNKEHAAISIKQLISLAEETGLIVPIGKWLLESACKQNKNWQETGVQPIQISVNVSMFQFRQKTFVKMLQQVLEETRLDPNYLELELTESIIMHDADYTTSVLKDLKSLGIHLSIDDFGTGYSSLNYLKLLPLDKLKIDQSFIRALTINPNDYAICRAIVMMAHSLNLKVIAEGVEDDRQLALLHSLHCDEAQGYLFSKPLPAESFFELLNTADERTESAVFIR